MILIVLTRPPQAPAPSRLVICNCLTVPTEGHTRLMLLALNDLGPGLRLDHSVIGIAMRREVWVVALGAVSAV